MDAFLDILKTHGMPVSAISAVLVFGLGVYKLQAERKATLFWKEFEVYHKLVKELVEPHVENAPMYAERQSAIVFEMRNFKRYYPFSLRMLKGLDEKAASIQNISPNILNELKLTITYIERKLKQKHK